MQIVDRLTITRQPASINVRAGSNVALRVGALSLLPIRYQWQLNGDDFPGATHAAPGFHSCAVTGDFRVLVSDNSSNVCSDTITLLRDRHQRGRPDAVLPRDHTPSSVRARQV